MTREFLADEIASRNSTRAISATKNEKAKIDRIPLDAITIRSRRPVDPAVISALAASMKLLGQLQPITVYKEDSLARLVAGHHRVCADKELGWDEIDAIFVTGDEIDLRLREIAENLHRAELTVQERSEQIAEWVRLTEGASLPKKVKQRHLVNLASLNPKFGEPSRSLSAHTRGQRGGTRCRSRQQSIRSP